MHQTLKSLLTRPVAVIMTCEITINNDIGFLFMWISSNKLTVRKTDSKLCTWEGGLKGKQLQNRQL